MLAAISMQIANGEEFSGIEFPGGSSSFADKVVSYEPTFGSGSAPTGKWLDSSQTLGVPNYTGGSNGDNAASLGGGGRITLQFIDNALTGSNNDEEDLYIFEIGPRVEDTFVEISKDGINFVSVGKVFGSTASIDIDSFGFTAADRFYFVRLTDAGSQTGTGSIGADIDAVGAISSIPVDCRNSTISQNLDIHIPNAVYQGSTGELKLWLNFKYVPNQEGKLLFELSNYGIDE